VSRMVRALSLGLVGLVLAGSPGTAADIDCTAVDVIAPTDIKPYALTSTCRGHAFP
jgi:hypothetical protein